MESQNPVLHILVVGFHHKKGCQVEFSYPPLITGTGGKCECPSGWKYLPTLALPDGSHNFTKDFVYFNLPSLTDPHESVYGISCYRQIPADELKIRTADVTRSTVQKSVCALLSVPIYGYIEVKLSLIAHTFFDQGDFSSTDILVDTYRQLNACLISRELQEPTPASLYYVGISVRELLLKWRHKLLILFKLLLLQKRVVCFGSPVQPTCALVLGIASLHPELINKGFQEVACVKTSRPMSPMPTFETVCEPRQPTNLEKYWKLDVDGQSIHTSNLHKSEDCQEAVEDDCHSIASANEVNPEDSSSLATCSSAASVKMVRETSIDIITSNFSNLCAIRPEEWGAPLKMFHSGYLCLPYISLPYIDLLTDPSVKGYIIGASNVLFQQKRQLSDVVVDVENAVIDVYDPELKRQMQLSTEDLRFVDFLVRNVQNPKEDAEGSESWIREQFYGYTVALLKSSLCIDGSKEVEHFNINYINALKVTQCYSEWFERTEMQIFDGLLVGHPFAGTLSVTDMKLRIAQTMQNSESGRKLNHAVNTTSRAVGGALSTAKGAFSTWWTSMTAAPPTVQQEVVAVEENDQRDSQRDDNVTVSGNIRKADEQVYQQFPLNPNDNVSDQRMYDELGMISDNKDTRLAIDTAELAQEQSNNIIEIGKEAELLDAQGNKKRTDSL